MGCIAIAAACITSIGIDYADLPTTTSSYSEDKSWDVSEFYDQKIPSFSAGGFYSLRNNNAITFNIDTGIHTDKLNTASLSLGYTKLIRLSTNWTLRGSTGIDYNFTKHTPCYDSENRDYYCGNLTAWKDFEDKDNHEKIYKASVRLNYTW